MLFLLWWQLHGICICYVMQNVILSLTIFDCSIYFRFLCILFLIRCFSLHIARIYSENLFLLFSNYFTVQRLPPPFTVEEKKNSQLSRYIVYMIFRYCCCRCLTTQQNFVRLVHFRLIFSFKSLTRKIISVTQFTLIYSKWIHLFFDEIDD